jgi:ABC-2 type transport system ATP-binding protein
MTPSRVAVSVQGLSKRFGGTRALADVTFEIPAGSLFGLLGPNGAGKTTLFSVAAGFLRPSAGRVEVLGIDVEQISRLRGRFSMLPQDARFQAGIPVFEQLVMFSRLNGLDEAGAQAASQKALELVGLGDVGSRSSGALSHGMLKRVQLCQAFLGDPEVVFLDEPTSGLDPENARHVREIVRGMRGTRTVVFSSHNLQEVQDLCDHAAIIHLGKLCVSGSMAELTGASFLVRISLSQPLPGAVEGELLSMPAVESLERTGPAEFNLRFRSAGSDGKDAAMKAVFDTLSRHGIYPRSVFEGASLEARFLEITGGKYDGASSR